MKFVKRILLVVLYTYLTIFSNLSVSKATKKIPYQNTCDTRVSGSSIIFRVFPIKVQLNWGGIIKDLDLIVSRKDGESANYQKRKNFDGNVYFLNDDVGGGTGKQEALEIKKMTTGKYLIFVNNVSREDHIGTSKGRVRFFHGKDQVLDIRVPKSDNNPSSLNWIVGLMEFSEEKAVFKLINKFTLSTRLNPFFEISDEDDNAPKSPVNLPPSRKVNVIEEKNYIEIRDFPIMLDLDWKEPNKDLDFYIKRSDGQQVYYNKIVNFGGKIKFSKDERGSQRHETLQIDTILAGKFIVYVNNYSKDAHLSRSSAEVKISSNGHQITSVRIPTNDTNPRNVNWVVGMFIFDGSGAKFIKANAFSYATGINQFFNTITIRGGSSPAPDAAPNSTGNRVIPDAAPNSTGNRVKPAAAPNSTGNRVKPAAAAAPQHSRPVPIRGNPSKERDGIVQIVHKSSGLCLDARGGRLNNGDDVILWPCHNGLNQKWHKRDLGGFKNVFALKNNRVSKVMDVTGSRFNNGAPIIIWDEHGGSNQKWIWNPSNGSIKSLHANKCIDVPFNRPGNGVRLQQYDCNGTAAQIFYLRFR